MTTDEAAGLGETYVAGPGPGTGPREPTAAELYLGQPDEASVVGLAPSPSDGAGLQGAELTEAVEMLEALKKLSGTGPFEVWQKAALIWGLRGLDINLDWPPQPYRAVVAVAVVGGSCAMEATAGSKDISPHLKCVPPPEDPDDDPPADSIA